MGTPYADPYAVVKPRTLRRLTLDEPDPPPYAADAMDILKTKRSAGRWTSSTDPPTRFVQHAVSRTLSAVPLDAVRGPPYADARGRMGIR